MHLWQAITFEVVAIIDFIIAFLLALFLFLITKTIAKRRMITLIAGLFLFGIIAAHIFSLPATADLLQVGYIGLAAAVLIIYSRNLREMLLSTKGNRNLVHMPLNQQEALIKEIMEAVLALSATKTGALITFEKNDSLENYIRAGETVLAPISSRLLRTIFTPGTPYHDGAVIIKGNLIVAASVFYTPTTRALTGKYGARHRAALGISEISDALTIVVSEETGRMSFTQAGEIYGVSRENFEKHLRDRLL